MTSARPIVVTGTHRAGTTWVGEMISKSPEVTYIHEPFNYPLWPQCPLTRHFSYITEQEEGPVRPHGGSPTTGSDDLLH
jgi:hypothetical protein